MHIKTYRILVGFALVLFICISWVGFRQFVQAQVNAGTSIHEQQNRLELSRLLSAMNEVETGSRGYILTGQADFLKPYNAGQVQATESIRKLKAFAATDPQIGLPITELDSLVSSKIEHSRKLVQIRQDLGFEAASKEFASGRGKEMMDTLRATISKLDLNEMDAIIQRGKSQDRQINFTRWLLLGGQLVSFSLLLAALFLLLRENKLRANAELELQKANDSLEQRVDRRSQELERANQAALENSERLKLSVEAAKIGLWDWNIVTNEVSFSDQWRSQLGYEDSEIGTNMGEWERLVHPDDHIQMRAETRRYLFHGEGPINQEFRILHKNGTWRRIFSRGEAYRDTEGRPVRMLGCHIDITDRTQIEEALRQSEERFQAFLNQSPIVAWVKDDQLKYRYANDGFAKLLGRKASDLVGHTDHEFMSEEFANAARANDSSVLESGSILESIQHVAGADGEYRHWLVHKFPLKQTGRESWVGGTAVDITARIEAERAVNDSESSLRAFMDAMPTPAMLFDKDMTFEAVNQSLADSFGMTKAELIGKCGNDLLPPDLAAARKLQVDTVVATGKELRFEDENGGRHYINYLSPILNLDGDVARIAVFTLDITQRKLAEQQQTRHLEELLAIYRLTDTLSRADSIEQVYESALDALIEGLKADRASILLFDSENVMRFVAWRGLSEEHRNAVDGHSPWSHEETNPHPILIEDISNDSDKLPFFEAFKTEGLKALEFIPLVQQGRLIGTLAAYFNEPHIFEDNEIQLVQTIASHVAFATERKRTERALQESEARFRKAAEVVGGVPYLLDLETNSYTYMGDAILSLTGYSSDEFDQALLNSMLLEVHMKGEGANMSGKDATALMHSGKLSSWSCDLLITTKSGERRWLSDVAVPVPDETGNVVSTIGFLQDVTERKQAEESLKLFRGLVERASDSIEVVDPETGQFLDMNERGCLDLGYSREELLQMKVQDIDPNVDDDALARIVHELRERANSQNEVAQLRESNHIRKDGTTFPVEVALRLVKLDREYVVASVRDVTERKQTEEALRESVAFQKAIIETEPECVKLIASDGSLIEMNAAGLRMIEADSLTEVQGHIMYPLIDEEYRDAFHELNERVFRGETGTLEFRLTGLRGSVRWLETHGCPLRDANGAITAQLAVTRDITSRKEAESALQSVLAGTSTQLGHDFFNSLVEHLASALNVKYAFVGEFLGPNMDRAFARSVWADGGFAEPFEYDLGGTPCANVAKNAVCFYPDSIQTLFPSDLLLQKLGVESYLGAPLLDKQGKPMGLLVVLHDQPMPDSEVSRSILKVFGARAGVELERLKGEELVRASEARLHAIVHTTPNVAMQGYDLQGKICLWNSASETMFGWSEQEAMGKTLDQLIHTPEEAAEFVQVLHSLTGTGRSEGPNEYRFKRRDGREAWCLSTIFEIPSTKDGPLFVCMDIDITDRKRAEITRDTFLELEGKLNATRDPQEAAQCIFAAADRLWNVDAGFLDAYDASNDLLEVILDFDIIDGKRQSIRSSMTIGPPQAHHRKILNEGPELILRQPPITQLDSDLIVFGDSGRPSASMMYVPVVWQGKAVGVLSVQSYTVNAFTDDDLQTLVALADHSGGTLERIRGEQALSESEIYKTAIFDSAMDAIISVDNQGLIIDFNPAAERMFRRCHDDVIGQPMDEMIIPPAWRKMHQEGFERYLRTKESEILNTRLELVGMRSDESEFPVELAITVLPGESQRFTAFLRDLTESKKAEQSLRESEQRFRTLVEAAPEAIVMLDVESGTFVEANENAVQLFECDRTSLLKMGPIDLSPPIQPDGTPSAAAAAPRIAEAIAGTQPVFEWTHRTAKGRDIPCEVRFVRMESGGKILVRGSITDISDRKRTEKELLELNTGLEARIAERTAELERATAEAEKANVAKSDFLSQMSHELRTPLNSVLGYAQLLEMEGANSRQLNYVDRIMKGGRHLLGLIDNVLEISRIEAEQVVISVEPVRVTDVVRECILTVQPMAMASGIRIEDKTRSTTASVLADRQRFVQVLINLLSNAIKFNTSGGKVVISTTSDEGFVSIVVSDTGIGISKEMQGRLFNPFERLAATGGPIEGTGLGLSLSRKLCQAMGGTIRYAAKRSGNGSVFTIILPLSKAPTIPLVEQIHYSPMRDLERFGPKKVLYIEDNLSNVELLKDLIENYRNISLLVAMKGFSGFEMAKENKPDVIILDLNLPDISGAEVLAKIKKSTILKKTPVIILSADATSKQIDRLMRMGAYSYMSKPLDVALFVSNLYQVFAENVLLEEAAFE